MLDKAARPSISNIIWILLSDTICQLNQFNTNSETAMLSNNDIIDVAVAFDIDIVLGKL